MALVALLTLTMMACTWRQEGKKMVAATTVEYTFPGEWEEHEGTWLIWPHNYGIISPEYVDMIDDIWVTMTEALHHGEKVHIVAYDAAEQTRISALLTEASVDMSQVDFTIAESDQFWARDCGPLFIMDSNGKPAILDCGYNGYGRMDKFGAHVPEDMRWELPEFVREEYMENYVKDNVLASTIAQHIGVECIDLNGFVLEGALSRLTAVAQSSPPRAASSTRIATPVLRVTMQRYTSRSIWV